MIRGLAVAMAARHMRSLTAFLSFLALMAGRPALADVEPESVSTAHRELLPTVALVVNPLPMPFAGRYGGQLELGLARPFSLTLTAFGVDFRTQYEGRSFHPEAVYDTYNARLTGFGGEL